VLWAGVEAGPELAALADAVARAVDNALGTAPDTQPAPPGEPREERVFSPHLTLARFDTPRGLNALHSAIEKAAPFEFGGATAKEFYLYQSVLKPGGAEYTRLATFTLAGRKFG
jgi:2'-5' RNA ligase